MKKKLVIVESPAKSKTIEKYLGSDYTVTSSKGHIRDLSKSGKGRLGIDLEHEYEPHYVISKEKKDTVADLKKACAKAEFVYLATDPDREGEAISWHLAEVLNLDINQENRIVFNEITKNAVVNALNEPRKIDMNLVHSQETRRVLDRIIGFKLSGLLQKKIKSKSAGRVQSVALRLIVEREREIQSFIPDEYWTITADLHHNNLDFQAELTKYKKKKIEIKNEDEANRIYNELSKELIVKDIKKVNKKREPRLVFTTSSLQQEASTKLGFSAKKTMQIAQKLYEGVDIGNETVGLITYMRTDSTRLSDVFTNSAFSYIEETYGKNYKGKIKRAKASANVQDAHEGIRPTDVNRYPDLIASHLKKDEYKLYKLIYARAVASLMAPAIFDSTTVLFDDNDYEFKSNGSVIQFDGYLKLYGEYESTENEYLPVLNAGEMVTAKQIKKEQHFTKPPARYTEAKLIKTMEELGIGRPSTYATIIDTILSREYVYLEKKAFVPTDSGFLTSDSLTAYFDSIINVKYTAHMEEQLDQIAEGNNTYLNAITGFEERFEPLLAKAENEMTKIEAEKTGEKCPQCGSDLVIRKGKYGKFVACSNYPECKYVQKPEVVLEETGELCPQCGSKMVYRNGRYGKFEACSNYPECKYIKQPEVTKKITIDESITEKCPKCGGAIVARKGRFGTFYACSNYPECKTIIKKKKG